MIFASSDEKFRTVHKDANFLFIWLFSVFWIARVSAWRLWESNQRHVLWQLQVLFCSRERPVWTVPCLRIFGANWCKKGQNSLFWKYCWRPLTRDIDSKCRTWTNVASNNSALAVCLYHFSKGDSAQRYEIKLHVIRHTRHTVTHCGILNFSLNFERRGHRKSSCPSLKNWLNFWW